MAEQETKLIALLRSDAAPGEKAIACKKLAIYGSGAAAPVLAPLLADPELASWARIALEAIPDPAAGEALRNALPNLQGRRLVGAINSIGVRRDAQATEALIAKLNDGDPQVGSAAADALGRIGGTEAARALRRSLTKGPTQIRGAVAEGCVRCAEQFMAEGKRRAAIGLYDAVREGTVPEEKRIEATRGAILARQTRGIPLLVDLLRSPDKRTFRAGLQIAREVPGHKATVAVADELRRSEAARQPLLLLALADRGDELAQPIIVEAAQRGSKEMRLVAIQVLERQGKLDSIPVLLEAATDPEDAVDQAALGALTRLPGYGVDDDLLARMAKADGKLRRVLITLTGKRQIKAALPTLLRYAQDPDAETRGASLQALETIGEEGQVADLVALVQKTSGLADRLDIEKALVAICGRVGSTSAGKIAPMAASDDPALRVAALRIFAAAGGPEALAAVNASVADKDEAVQDEAVHILATWPNTWPEDGSIAEPLLNLAKSGSKMSYKVLALRGYLQYVKGDKGLKGEDKLTKVNQILPLIARPEDKRLAIATVGDIPAAGTLELLTGFAAEPAVADDACSAMVNAAARKMPGVSKETRERALRFVIDKCGDTAIKQRAEAALKNL